MSEARMQTRSIHKSTKCNNLAELDGSTEPAKLLQKTIEDIRSMPSPNFDCLNDSSYINIKIKHPVEEKLTVERKKDLKDSALAKLLLEPVKPYPKKRRLSIDALPLDVKEPDTMKARKIRRKSSNIDIKIEHPVEEKEELTIEKDLKDSALSKILLEPVKPNPKKRRLSIDSAQLDVKEPGTKQARKRRRKSSHINESTTITIKNCIKDIPALFKDPPEEKFCFECGGFENDHFEVYKCLKCDNHFHSYCAAESESVMKPVRLVTGDCDMLIHRWTAKLTCKACHSREKSCFLCLEKIEDGDEMIQCKIRTCSHSYHLKCLENCLQSNLANSKVATRCPQHVCYTCLAVNRYSKGGKMAKCIKCTAAYHIDGLCLPAGTKVFTESLILCPRHKSIKEEHKAIKNLEFCHSCLGDVGPFTNCPSCPNAFHKQCNQNDLCKHCMSGNFPLYNTHVWVFVDDKWKFGYILTPQDDPDKSERKDDQKFCVKITSIAGMSRHVWVTFDQVVRDNPMMQSLFKEEPLEFITSTPKIEGKGRRKSVKQEAKQEVESGDNKKALAEKKEKVTPKQQRRKSARLEVKQEESTDGKKTELTPKQRRDNLTNQQQKLTSQDPIMSMLESHRNTFNG